VPRPRIHLSTALILLLLTAALLCVNIYRTLPPPPPRPAGVTNEMYESMLIQHSLSGEMHLKYGWPARAAEEVFDTVEDRDNSDFASLIKVLQWHPRGVAINATVALVILTLAAFLLEWRARRKV